MAVELELQEGERIEREVRGDYWEKIACFYSQKSGKYTFTNRRILFRGGFVAKLDIAYYDIESVKTCNVGPLIHIIPTGIKLKMKDGKTYRLSVLKRKSIIDLIESRR